MAVTCLIIGHFYPDFAQKDSVMIALCHILCCYRRASKLKAQGKFYKYDLWGAQKFRALWGGIVENSRQFMDYEFRD